MYMYKQLARLGQNLFLFWYFCIFKYINLFILLELICVSSDLPDVIIFICAGQLNWTARKNLGAANI